MTTVNVHDAKTHLSRLLDRVVEGETIIIARAGKPVAQLTPLAHGSVAERRLGFLQGRSEVPDDFDRMDEEDLIAEFEGRG
jgi:prevent-host-death family protein